MAFQCPTREDCGLEGPLGVDLPYANLSSEGPDLDLSYSENYGYTWVEPPLGSNWQRSHCRGVCFSSESQFQADLCAVIQNLICLIDTWGTCTTCFPGDPGGGGGVISGPPLYGTRSIALPPAYNDEQTCSISCPDGNPFSYTLPAGMVAATSKALANAIAQSVACQQAELKLFCLGDIDGDVCYAGAFNQTITSTLNVTTWSIVSGSLPPGITTTEGEKELVLSGVANTAGSYTFAIQALNTGGTFVIKTYTINVLGISNSSTLPDGTLGNAYNVNLNGVGGTAPYTFALSAGALPAGLALSSGGNLGGIPADSGDFTFTVDVTDSSDPARTCSKEFNLHLANSACYATPTSISTAPNTPSIFSAAGSSGGVNRAYAVDLVTFAILGANIDTNTYLGKSLNNSWGNTLTGILFCSFNGVVYTGGYHTASLHNAGLVKWNGATLIETGIIDLGNEARPRWMEYVPTLGLIILTGSYDLGFTYFHTVNAGTDAVSSAALAVAAGNGYQAGATYSTVSGKFYVPYYDAGTPANRAIHVRDTGTLALSATICGGSLNTRTPISIAYCPTNDRLYMAVSNTAPAGDEVLCINPASGAIEDVISLPFSTNGRVFYDSQRGYIIICRTELYMIDPASNTIVCTLAPFGGCAQASIADNKLITSSSTDVEFTIYT